MRHHKTSVLLVNTDGKHNKALQIPTKLLLNWKKYLVILVSIIFCLLGITCLLIYRTTSEHYKEKLAKANRIKSLIDISKAKKTFHSIDESIFRINHSLQERGLAELKMENMGGGTDFEITDINEVVNYYEKQILEMEHVLEFMPLGKPFEGEITSSFGIRRNPFTGFGREFHSGIDFKGNTGDSIRSTAAGIVEFAGRKGCYGNCIIINHGKKMKTLYGHLSKVKVTDGQKVEAGEFIGLLGSTGRSTGPHLHYEILNGENRINPEKYMTFN